MSTTIHATSKPTETLLERQYVCKRCGIVKTKGSRNTKAEYCGDCQPDAAALGWIPPLKTWDRKKKQATS